MPKQISRRQFIQKSALVGAATLAAPSIVSCRSPNEKLNLAIVGCGGRGGHNMGKMLGENIVAICDVNANNLRGAARRAPKAQQFTDFRKMFDKLKDSEFDGVVVSSTEHTHAFATLPALKRKKHVYCEKPLTHNLREARIITEAAKKAGVATQMGTQIHAGENYRRVVELIQSGAIGQVSEAHVWVGRAWGRQSQAEARRHRDLLWSNERPKKAMEIPRHLDWDLWLGPAPRRPYHSVYFPGPKWYRWWDFGGGTMSDLGSHWIDLPFWALSLDAPHTIEAGGPAPHDELAPASMTATFHYGKRGRFAPVKVSWYQGTYKPTIWQMSKIPQWGSGCLFIGTEGMLLANYGRHVLLPEKKFADFKRPAKSIPRSRGHHEEWIHACKTGAPTTCHFGYSGLLTEANHLGNVAYRLGKRLQWDHEKMNVTNVSDADQLLGREYRKGWELS